jgi:hypothetical protein
VIAPDVLHRLLAELEPYARLAAAGGLRAGPLEGRDGQGGAGDPQAAADRLHDRGTLARGREVYRRMGRMPFAVRPALLWLSDRGASRPDPRTAARLLAGELGPIALRDRLDTATRHREAAARRYAVAGPRRGEPLTVDGAKAHDAMRGSTTIEQTAEDALVAWGDAVLCAAAEAWFGNRTETP